jgi:hypothetical protein
MNYIRHLTGFFDRVAREDRLNPTHISLYMSLFQFWNVNRFVNPISISRSEMMSVSKICSKATYHKVMKELHQFGFIKYEPSYNPFRGSSVTLLNFEEVQKENREHIKKRTSSNSAVDHYNTKMKSGTERLNEPYINSKNIINDKLSKQQAHANTSSNFDKGNSDTQKSKKEKSTIEKNSTPGPNQTTNNQHRTTKTFPLPQSVEEIKNYFESQKSTQGEAEKFFNYFQSNGWKVGGRAPMKDWQAAARNWILNADKFASKSSRTVSFAPDKNYAEPL